MFPVLSTASNGTDELIERCILAALSTDFCHEGDQIVLTAGIPVGQGVSTNFIKVHTIGDIVVSGTGIGNGIVSGKVVHGSTVEEIEHSFVPGSILVCRTTGTGMIAYIEKAGAVVVEEGGLTSNAAILGLHYNIPTVVGATDAYALLEEGEEVTVDASTGVVYKGIQAFA